MLLRRISFSLLLVSLSLGAVVECSAERLESMKLLSPGTGWAATANSLYWTINGGKTWRDITPKTHHRHQTISSVFFLDTAAGWAVLRCADDRDEKADDICFEFASTTDAGETWSVGHPKIVDPDPEAGFSGRTFLGYADRLHGWAILKVSRAVSVSFGIMLKTEDGGKTWKVLPAPPIADHFIFITAKDGWLEGGPNADLYVTHDAGGAWARVAVAPPAAVKWKAWPPGENDVWPYNYLPFFEDPKHGFLIGSYWEDPNDPSTPAPTFVLFSTIDIGVTWRLERLLPEVRGAVAVSRGTLFEVSNPKNMDTLTLRRQPLIGSSASAVAVSADVHDIPIRHHLGGGYTNLGYDELVMADGAHGWLLADELLATGDGGASWTDVTPGGPPRAVPPGLVTTQ